MLSARQIPPGESGQIEVTVSREDKLAIDKSVRVTTNDPSQPTIALRIRAVIVPEFSLSEKNVWFGSVPKGKKVVKEILIDISPDSSSSILSAVSTDPTVESKLISIPGSDGKKIKLQLIHRAASTEGYHFGRIVLKTTSLIIKEIRIPIRGLVTST